MKKGLQGFTALGGAPRGGKKHAQEKELDAAMAAGCERLYFTQFDLRRAAEIMDSNKRPPEPRELIIPPWLKQMMDEVNAHNEKPRK